MLGRLVDPIGLSGFEVHGGHAGGQFDLVAWPKRSTGKLGVLFESNVRHRFKKPRCIIAGGG